MTAVAAPAPTGMADLEIRGLVRAGLIAGAVLLLVIGVGMFEIFNGRKMIDPYLSAGYAAVIWIPLVFGYRVSVRPVLEGIETTPPGRHNIIAGMITGAIAGGMLGLLLLFASVVNIRSIFINISPSLIDLLGYGGSVISGAAIIIVGSAVLGAAGGGFHLISERAKMVLLTVVATVIGLNFLELVIGDILRAAGLRAVDRMIYAPSRGVTPLAAVLICAAVVGLRFALKGRSKVVGARYKALPEDRRRKWLFVGGVVAIGLGTFLPTVFGLFLNEILSNVGLFILLGLGLNIVIGYAGLLDLGYVAFFAVGAYTTAVTTSSRSPAIAPELAFFQALPWVLLMALIAGLVIGTPVIRMRGDYLAIVTLGFGEIIRIAFNSDWLSGVFGGAQGILRIAPLEEGVATSGIRVDFGYVAAAIGLVALIVGILRMRDQQRVERGEVGPLPNGHHNARTNSLMIGIGALAVVLGMIFPTFSTWTVVGINPPDMFRIILVFVAIAAFVSWRLRDSRVGRAWMAVREDEQIAQSMGINIVTTKLLAFVMGAMLASLGGAMFAVKLGTIFPHSFEIIQSIIILVVVIVGGMGSIRGVAIGAIVLIGILGGPTQPGLLREFGEFKLLIYGVILVWMMLKRPEGLWPEARRAQELHVDELAQDAWLRSQEMADAEEDGS